MKPSIFQALAAAAMRGESVALGIITAVKGSSPQKLGAKALFHADRRIQGTLGGGCLEAEAQRLALQSLRDGKPQPFELVLDHDFGWDDGLICGGKVSGVILPNAQAAGEQFWSELARRDITRSWGVTSAFKIRLVEASPPREEEHHLSPSLFSIANGGEGGRRPGAEALRCPGKESAQSIPEESAGKSVAEAPVNSGWLYCETLTPPCALWIAGSGHLAQAVAPLALQLDFAVSVFDDRPELANHSYFPDAVTLHTGSWGELCQHPFSSAPTFGLIVTRGHKHDALVLETWIHRPFQFLGMIGSTRKARSIANHFVQQKLATAEEIARVACPVGIRIRSRSVMEIAVDILAQYIDKRAELVADQQVSPAGKVELA